MSRGVLAVLAAAAFLACSQEPLRAPGRATSGPDEAGEACLAVRTTEDLGADHVEEGKTASYPGFPPASGPHDPHPLPAGVYERPLSSAPSGSNEPTVFRAVHSLEHGYVIAFHSGLDEIDAAALRRLLDGQRKVILAPGGDDAPAPLILVAWRRVQLCRRFDAGAVREFVSSFREQTAPEPGGA